MARSASRIRSVMAQLNFFNGLMVAAMSGKSVEFRRPAPKLNKEKVFLPVLGRQIKVIKKVKLGEEVSRQRTDQLVVSLRSGLLEGVNTSNYQRGGTKLRINKYHPLGDERLSSEEMGIYDRKRQQYRPKGSQKLRDIRYDDPFVKHYEYFESLI